MLNTLAAIFVLVFLAVLTLKLICFIVSTGAIAAIIMIPVLAIAGVIALVGYLMK